MWDIILLPFPFLYLICSLVFKRQKVLHYFFPGVYSILLCGTLAYFYVHGSGEDGMEVAIFESVLMLLIFLLQYVRNEGISYTMRVLIIVPAVWLFLIFFMSSL